MHPSELIRQKAPLILAEINKAKSVLLHCHPAPDPDSVGSALAMKFALEQLGKKATVIAGDSVIPEAFMHFPGAQEIVAKNFLEIDQNEFDLFIVLDGSADRVSNLGPVKFSEKMAIVNIDHHRSNLGFGIVSLVEANYPSTAQILYDLFTLWNVKLTREIALNLFVGMYTDTGGFKYVGTTAATYEAAAKLVAVAPNFHEMISKMESSRTPEFIRFQSLAFGRVEVFFGGALAISVLPYQELKAQGLLDQDFGPSDISFALRFVGSWSIVACLFETAPGISKLSMRTNQFEKYDLSKVTVALGGGGHRAAAGATVKLPIEAAKEKVVQTIKDMYNL